MRTIASPLANDAQYGGTLSCALAGAAAQNNAMTKDGEMCWTVADTAIGATTETVSDKGEKLMVTRVAYVAKTMPAAG